MRTLIKGLIRKWGYEVRKIKVLQDTSCSAPYLENPETGIVNLDEKEKRLSEGGPFEWPDIVALNKTVVTLLGDHKNILEVGCGTGCFAWHAAQDPSRRITASEMDKKALDWAKANRSLPNIQYCSKWLNEFTPNAYDVVVSIDVIEHVKEYVSFLKDFSKVAPDAIISTPNKDRDASHAEASPPKYKHHVREWTAGEFYWILRTFYKDVKLYSKPDPLKIECVPINVLSALTPLIGVCKGSFNCKN